MKMRKLVMLGLMAAVGACGGGGSENKATNNPTTTTSSATPTTSAVASTGGTTTQTAPKAPLADLMKKTGADFAAAWAAHDAAKCAAAYANDAVSASPGPDGWKEENKDAVQKHLADLFTAFPDVKMTQTRMYMKGNVVASEGVMTGTNSGPFMGNPATNKKIGSRYFNVMWFNDDGLIQKQHLYHDHATMLGHLGKGDAKWKVRNLEAVPTVTLEQVSPGDNALEAKNEAAVRAWFAAFEKKDEKAYVAGIADDVTHADYTRPEDVKGKDAVKKSWHELLTTFPDLKMTPTSVMAIGNYVIAEVDMSGTMKGDMGSVKSSGKSGTAHLAEIFRLKDGKIEWAARFGSRAEFASAFGVPAKLPPPAGQTTGKPATTATTATTAAPTTPPKK
jgi:steroid delta-isomerase-like uncharacterized protein